MTAADKPKLLGKSRLDYLKIKQELYGQFFEEFLALNKINIKSYDAVIGPEYNLGGNQLCILHQNGQPSKLSVRIRALLRRATPVARWSSTSANPVSPKPGIPVEVEPPPIIPKLTFRAGLKFVGGILVGVLVALMIAVLDSWLTKKLNVRIIENEMKRLEPKIKLRVAKHKRQILDQLSAGRPTFIIVTVDVSYSRDVDPDAGPTNSPPSVDLVSVIISQRKLEGAGDSWMDKQVMSTLNHEEYHFSIEATAAKVDLDSYRDTIKQLDWYETALKDPNLTSDDVARLTKEKQALEEFFRKLLDS